MALHLLCQQICPLILCCPNLLPPSFAGRYSRFSIYTLESRCVYIYDRSPSPLTGAGLFQIELRMRAAFFLQISLWYIIFKLYVRVNIFVCKFKKITPRISLLIWLWPPYVCNTWRPWWWLISPVNDKRIFFNINLFYYKYMSINFDLFIMYK